MKIEILKESIKVFRTLESTNKQLSVEANDRTKHIYLERAKGYAKLANGLEDIIAEIASHQPPASVVQKSIDVLDKVKEAVDAVENQLRELTHQ